MGKGANLYKLGYQLDGSVAGHHQLPGHHLAVGEGARAGRRLWRFLPVRPALGRVHVSVLPRPEPAATLETTTGPASFLRDLELSQDELTKSIIGAIGDLDAYQLPDAKGFTSLTRYLAGETDEARQRCREQVLATDPEDFHAFGEALEVK